MKYGDALPQRSVLEWLPYNLDYTEVKELIKRYTTTKTPVESPEQKTNFEDELFEVLADQLSRIDLFVKSKSGEIDRRLNSCQRQVTILQRRTNNRASSRVSTRYAKVESEIERAGNDIQSLSRFVNVQRTGFHKLLKKYQKWTGSAHLTSRFRVLLESPTAFHRQDFETCVLEVSELLAAVRNGINGISDIPNIQPIQNGRATRPSLPNPKPTSISFQKSTPQDSPISPVLKSPQRTSPQQRSMSSYSDVTLKPLGGRAVLWVHNDYMIELQVALLRNLTIKTSSPMASVTTTPALSRRNSFAGVVSGKDDEIASVLFDDLENFSGVQNSATIESVSQSGMRTAGQVWWRHHDPEAHLIVTDSSISGPGRRPTVLEVSLKRKHVELLIDPNSKLPLIKDALHFENHRIRDIRDWFIGRPRVIPLAKILSKRTVFTGEIADGQVCVTIDREIRMKALRGENGWSNSAVDDEDMDRDENSDVLEFPHGVVEIKWDGNQVPSFIEEIVQSHMVENMPGFALDVHAIAVLYKPEKMTPPFWLRALEKDIRKTPSRSLHHSRANSTYGIIINTSSKNSSTVTGHSSSGFKDGSHTTPGTSDAAVIDISSSIASRKKKQVCDLKRPRLIESISGEHYWSEFNDGSDFEDSNEPYTVVIAPSIAGSEEDIADHSLYEFIVSPITRTLLKFKKGFTEKPRHPNENTPLVDPQVDDDSSSSEDEAIPGGLKKNSYRYGTYAPVKVETNSINDLGHLVFMVVSFLILLITSVLALNEAMKRRRRHHPGDPQKRLVLDLGVVTGVMVSLVFAIIGITIFLIGKFKASWIHTLSVWIMFGGVCVGSGAVFALVGRTEMDAGSP